MKQQPPVQATGRQKAATAGSDEKRERILRAAEALFDAQGYANTTIEQIVQQLGVTKPFVYYYFRNKQEPHPSAFFPYREPQVYRPEYLAAQKDLANHFYDRLCALLEQGRQDGMFEFNDTKITALAACSLPGFLYNWYRPDGRLSQDEVAQELAQLAWRVLGLRRTRKRNPA